MSVSTFDVVDLNNKLEVLKPLGVLQFVLCEVVKELERLRSSVPPKDFVTKPTRSSPEDDREYQFFERHQKDGRIQPLDPLTSAHSDPSLIDGLNQRLQYYLQYRIKDMVDGRQLYFIRGHVIDDKFFVTMSPQPPSANPSTDLRCYRLERVDARGRDIFRHASSTEQERLAACQEHRLPDLPDGSSRTFVTELMFMDRCFVVFSIARAATAAPDHQMAQRVQAVSEFASDAEQRITSLEKAITNLSVSAHTDNLITEDATINDVPSEDEQTGSIMPSSLASNAHPMQWIKDVERRFDELESSSATLGDQINNRLGPRVEFLEASMSRVLQLPAVFSDTSTPDELLFYPHEPTSQSINSNNYPPASPSAGPGQPVSDPGLLHQLHSSLQSLRQLRLSSTQGQSLAFSQGIAMDGHFYVAMRADDSYVLHYFAQEGISGIAGGASAFGGGAPSSSFRPATADERQRLSTVDPPYSNTSVVEVGGVRRLRRQLTDVFLGGRLYSVHTVAQTGPAALECSVHNLEQWVEALQMEAATGRPLGAQSNNGGGGGIDRSFSSEDAMAVREEIRQLKSSIEADNNRRDADSRRRDNTSDSLSAMLQVLQRRIAELSKPSTTQPLESPNFDQNGTSSPNGTPYSQSSYRGISPQNGLRAGLKTRQA